MALSGTNRGTGGNATSATTINISPTSNFTAGSIFMLAIAYDNAGNAGADNYSSITVPAGIGTSNVSRQPVLNDPGAANAGTVLHMFWSPNPITSFNTTDTITITFSSNVTAKAWTLTEFISDISGATISSLSLTFTTGNGTTQSLGSITGVQTGDIVFGVLTQEGNGTRTADSDTTNGNWSTMQNTGFGTTTAGQEIITQFKIVTAGGAQVFDPTASPIGDWAMSILPFREIPPATSFDPLGMMGFYGI